MARKLKSDNVLFLATILLVALSIVMVYSASAPVALRAVPAGVVPVPDQAGHVGGARDCRARPRDAHRLPHLPRAGLHLDAALVVVAVALVAVLFSPPVNNARRWFGLGGHWHPAVGAREARARSSSSRRCSSGGCTASTKCGTRCCRSAIVVAVLVGLILLEPDFGTSMSLVADRRGHGVRRRPQLPLHRRRARSPRCLPCLSSRWARPTAGAGCSRS